MEIFKNWAVQREEKHVLWKEFIEWMNDNSSIKFIGRKKDYYGYVGRLRGFDDLSKMPKDTQIIDLYQWKSLVKRKYTACAGSSNDRPLYFIPSDISIETLLELIKGTHLCQKMLNYPYDNVQISLNRFNRFSLHGNVSEEQFRNAGYKEMSLVDLINFAAEYK